MALLRPAEPVASNEVAHRRYSRDIQGLTAQLRDADPGVRRWAVRDLVSRGAATSDETAALLGQCLQHDPDEQVRSALLNGLASVGTPAAVNALLPLLRSEDACLRNGAIEALASLPQVTPHIERLLQDSDPDVRIFTVNLLGDLRRGEVPGWLVAVLLQDSEVNVVAAAIEVMAEVGRPQDVVALHTARARFSQDAFVGFAVDMAVARIQQQ